MNALAMRRNPVRDALLAGGTAYGVMAFEFFTPGLDLGWLGHYDLSDSLGCVEDFAAPRYRAAEAKLLAAATTAGKPLGWLVPTGQDALRARERGYRCICIGHEVGVFRNALTREFAVARGG